MSTLIREPSRYRITAILRRADGSERIEDLGVHEALVGRKAKERAIYMHAGRLGSDKRAFRIALEKTFCVTTSGNGERDHNP